VRPSRHLISITGTLDLDPARLELERLAENGWLEIIREHETGWVVRFWQFRELPGVRDAVQRAVGVDATVSIEPVLPTPM
jgi:hypothetical protein